MYKCIYTNLIYWFNRIIWQVTGLNISTGNQTFSKLCPRKAAFVTDITDQHEVKKLFSYWRLKPQKYSVSIVLFCSGFSFYELFNRQFIEAVFLQSTRKMCLSKKILYQYFVVFCPADDTFSPENMLYVIA